MIIITGMHRSGTSLVAQTVSRLGADPGEPANLIPPNPHNLSGYWEDRDVVALNDAVLAALGGTWAAPPPQSFDLWKGVPSALHQRADELVSARKLNGRTWLWKDPRFCILQSFWGGHLTGDKWIVVVRNPLDIAGSLRKREGFPPYAALILWQHYLSALLPSLSARQTLFVDYDLLCDQPVLQCERMIQFVKGRDLLSTIDHCTILHAVECIQPLLRHCHPQRPNNAVRLSASQQRLYSFLVQCTLSPSGCPRFEPDEIFNGWREMLILWQEVSRLLQRVHRGLY